MNTAHRWVWNWGGMIEPGLEALCQWMDREMHRPADTRVAMLGATIGTTWGFAGGLIGLLLGGLSLPPWWIALPVALASAITVGAIAWYVKTRNEEERALAKLRGEARGVIQRLWLARWSGTLKQSLGEASAYALNEAAKQWLRLRSALDSPAWKAAGAESPWSSARDNSLKAMDAPMAQMVLLAAAGSIGVGAAEAPAPNDDRDGGSRSLGAGEAILAEMRRMAEEAVALTERLATRTGTSSDSAASDLRAALAELRALAEAEDEFERSRRGTGV